ncbi:MAG: peptidoglycan-associated lipoprotein Pal [Desulfobacter sp.]|nr:MAG: peptidoglycan-associated lipoprotein Pal [Desulfobacter sp.]
MERKLWMRLMMAVLVAGLMMTVSCAQKKVVTEPTTVEDKAKAEAEAAAEKARIEAERIKAQELAEKLAKEQAAKIAAAKNRFVNQNIHFEYDSAELSSMAKMLLKEKAEWLNANPAAAVTIQGHCDERGTTEYNLALGERRAQAARNYLVDLGISAGRLDMISYGEERPIDPAKTPEAFRKNRRAQFVIK